MKKALSEQLAPGYSISVDSNDLLAVADGPFPLEIHDTDQFGKTLYMGGHFMTSEVDEFVYHELMVHPAMVSVGWADRLLVIGGGDGGAIEEILKHRSVRAVDLVEIDRFVIDFSDEHLQSINQGKLRDPRVKIHITDGYDFVMRAVVNRALADDEMYDVIILDLTDPEGPAEKLYTEEFFSACKHLLRDDGAFVFHLGSVWTHPDRVHKLYTAAAKVFPEVKPFTAFVPLYGTLWAFALCRPFPMDEVEPENNMEPQIEGLKYYSPEIHRAMFVLPPFVQQALSGGRK